MFLTVSMPGMLLGGLWGAWRCLGMCHKKMTLWRAWRELMKLCEKGTIISAGCSNTLNVEINERRDYVAQNINTVLLPSLCESLQIGGDWRKSLELELARAYQYCWGNAPVQNKKTIKFHCVDWHYILRQRVLYYLSPFIQLVHLPLASLKKIYTEMEEFRQCVTEICRCAP